MSDKDWLEGYRQALRDIESEIQALRRLSVLPAWEPEIGPDGKEHEMVPHELKGEDRG